VIGLHITRPKDLGVRAEKHALLPIRLVVRDSQFVFSLRDQGLSLRYSPSFDLHETMRIRVHASFDLSHNVAPWEHTFCPQHRNRFISPAWASPFPLIFKSSCFPH